MSDAPDKTCVYCGKVGKAYTFMNGEIMCAGCLTKFPDDTRELRQTIQRLRDINRQLVHEYKYGTYDESTLKKVEALEAQNENANTNYLQGLREALEKIKRMAAEHEPPLLNIQKAAAEALQEYGQ